MKLLGLIAAAVTTAAGVVQAQAPQVPEGFTVGGNIVHENLPATPFVFIAYGIVWVVLLFYVFTIWRRVGRVDQELARVNQRLGARR